MLAIEASGVTKIYRRYGRRRHFATLKSALLTGSLLRDLRAEESFAAVDNVSFSVRAGTTFGIVGRNGSGKSTMLKLVAGITKPTQGTVSVTGRISALIELGAGFHPEISGRENIFINAVMLGLSKREIMRRFDEIVEFAEVRDFIDAPVKTYSSGMYVRLGFAVAIHVDPDVLLVDEVLAVGDQGFTHKCLDKFAEFKRRGKTILLVTHSLDLVERFCDEALWLEAGRVGAAGDPRRVVSAYLTDVAKSEERQLAAADAKVRDETVRAEQTSPPAETQGAQPAEPAEGPPDMFKASEGRWGSREAEIVGVEIVGDDGRPGHIFRAGDRVSVRIRFAAREEVTDFVFGIGLFNAEGVCCYGTNTDIEGFEAERLKGEGEAVFTIDHLDLVDGTYKIDVAIHRCDGYPYDYHRLLYSFRVKSPAKDVGIFRPSHTWRFSPEATLRAARKDSGGSPD